MKTEKPDIRYFCNRCAMEYHCAGYDVKKVYCQFKDDCSKCGYHTAYTYELKQGRFQ